MYNVDISTISERTKTHSNLKQLIQLALPVIATSFMSMAYNFINIFFVGRLGSNAVAAIGSAGFYMNLTWGISALVTVGTGIKVSHATGAHNFEMAKAYIRNGQVIIHLISIVFYILIALLSKDLIGFVKLNNPEIEHAASNYLIIVGISIPFLFQNLFYTSIFIGYGDSKIPFRINTLVFILNMLLDPILIFMLKMGINGAAVATIISQVMGTFLFYRKLKQTEALNPVNQTLSFNLLKGLIILGLSPSIQRISFTLVAIMMARIISNWGATAIAVQKVGIQIEAISFMTASGFMHAASSMSGKAFGAKDYIKQWNTFQSGMFLAFLIGLTTSLLFILFPATLISFFLHEKESIAMGSNYLTILGYSQLFTCFEFLATGSFFGWGKTNIPAFTGISLTILRIPMALIFIQLWNSSLSSVWWSISISSIAKGIVLSSLYVILFKQFIKKQKTL